MARKSLKGLPFVLMAVSIFITAASSILWGINHKRAEEYSDAQHSPLLIRVVTELPQSTREKVFEKSDLLDVAATAYIAGDDAASNFVGADIERDKIAAYAAAYAAPADTAASAANAAAKASDIARVAASAVDLILSSPIEWIDKNVSGDIKALALQQEFIQRLSVLKTKSTKEQSEFFVDLHEAIEDEAAISDFANYSRFNSLKRLTFYISVSSLGCALLIPIAININTLKGITATTNVSSFCRYLPEEYLAELAILKKRWIKQGLPSAEVERKYQLCLLNLLWTHYWCRLQNILSGSGFRAD